MALLVAVTVVAVRSVSAGASGCSGTGVTLNVAAAPDIAPAVREAANRWMNGSHPEIDGACVRVEVSAAAPAEVANGLAVRAGSPIDVAAKPLPTPSEDTVPAVWIPDSTSWLTRLRGVDQGMFADDAPSVAMSPVVLGMPEPVARAILGGPDKRIDRATLGQLLTAAPDPDPSQPKMTVGLVDPRRDAPSLAGAALMSSIVVGGPSDLLSLAKVFRGVRVEKDQAALAKAFSGTVTAAPLTEQAVLTYDAASPAIPLAAVPVVPSAAAMDYPFATISGKPRAIGRAADMLRAALTGRAYRDVFARNGFREPDGTTVSGFPAGHGASADLVKAPAMDAAATFRDALGTWAAANSPSRVLALLDTSSSMGQSAETGQGAVSRLALLQQAAIGGLALFTDDSQVGMWTYNSSVQPAVPVGPLSTEQRTTLTQALGSIQLGGTNNCGLYDAIYQAYEETMSSYQDDRNSTIVVFTDGSNTKGRSLKELLDGIEQLTDTTKPVNTVLLGIGPQADMSSLNRIAEATGGRAWEVKNPADIGTIFLEALLAGAATRQ